MVKNKPGLGYVGLPRTNIIVWRLLRKAILGNCLVVGDQADIILIWIQYHPEVHKTKEEHKAIAVEGAI